MAVNGVYCYLELQKNGVYWVPASIEIEYDYEEPREYDAQLEDGSELLIPDESVYSHFDQKTGLEYPSLSKDYDLIIKEIIQRETKWKSLPTYVEYRYFRSGQVDI